MTVQIKIFEQEPLSIECLYAHFGIDQLLLDFQNGEFHTYDLDSVEEVLIKDTLFPEVLAFVTDLQRNALNIEQAAPGLARMGEVPGKDGPRNT